ncbi:hypothetical protein NRY68_05590 [Acidithiobacillus ferrooxidans]|uniref:hypothetical protein n=1 Tax=Acidithiobacillus ferrooxidans TaxID=920 RepID=UPI002147550C|nr:hypothetical protein [Acidithiobacillus ferrooxidans]MCR1345278.1 hypothetical protein [Acidithiobacillus ferrooxidans]MCR1354438.1 hypothetical protein [Acidithiobacillus ferrooxidans]
MRIKIEVFADLVDVGLTPEAVLVKATADRVQNAISMGLLDAEAPYSVCGSSVTVNALETADCGGRQ